MQQHKKNNRKAYSIPPLTKRNPNQKGGVFDIQKWLGETGMEFHWPGYQYMGPGTNLKKRLARGDSRINRLDRIAKEHDIDYSNAKSLADKHKANRKMIKAIGALPGRKTWTEGIVKKNHASQSQTEIVT